MSSIGVIINADDYGLSNGVCEAINELAKLGAISNTTMMLCAEGAPDTISAMLTSETRKIAGVHLQLTGGSPLSDFSEIPSLIQERGKFKDPRKELVDPAEVYVEWKSQIELSIKLLGKRPTHIDSHHGMQRNSNLFPVYARLAEEYELPFRGANDGVKATIVQESLPGTVAIARKWTGSCAGPEGLASQLHETVLEFGPTCLVEVVAHPGFSDNYLRRTSSLNDKRECDYIGLLEAFRQGTLKSEGFYLTSFQEAFCDAYAAHS